MKKLLYALPFLFMAWISVAQNTDSLFAQANRLYLQGEYAQAEKIYQNILNTGRHSADLYYNLGNTAYKQNKLVDAVYYYEKALKLNPRHKQARQNLEITRRAFQYKTDELPEVLYKKMWRKFVMQLPAEVWGFLSLVVLYISLAIALVFMFSEYIKRRKAAFYILPFTTFLWLFFLLASYSAEKYNAKLYAIVFDNQAELYAEPSLNAEVKGKVYAGQKVEILQETDYWTQIKLPNGQTYWISKEAYRKL